MPQDAIAFATGSTTSKVVVATIILSAWAIFRYTHRKSVVLRVRLAPNWPANRARTQRCDIASTP
jgi:hypothetical protein